jgi:xanthine/uracil permease
LRLAALAAGGLLGAGLMLRLGTMGTPLATAGWAAAAALLGIVASSLMVWSATSAIPGTIHQSLPNRILGVVPALVAGAIILALGLSLAERVALRQGTGLVTGPLVAVVDLVEQRAAGLR